MLSCLILLASGCGAKALPGRSGDAGNRPALGSYLAADPAQRRAILALVARTGGRGAGRTFDGCSHGSLLVTVPMGWTLLVDLKNEGPSPTSVAVVARAGARAPLVAGAATLHPRQGIPPGAQAGFSWFASRPGTYALASLVPGQAEAGLWATLRVVRQGRPSLQALGRPRARLPRARTR
jgi:hypothetical protein